MGEFRMPSLGADMESGTLVGWKVKPGDSAKRGDIVADVETQKGVIEIEVFDDSIFDALVIPEGEKVPVGAVLAYVHKPGESPSAIPSRPSAERKAAPVSERLTPPPYVERPTPAPAVSPRAAERVRASPAARKAAEALHVNLAGLVGSGPGGAISVQDVERAAKTTPAVAPSTGPEAMRAAIAAAMSRSKREIPHYYLSNHLDVTRALAWLEQANRERPVTERLLPVVLWLKAVARAVKMVPRINGHFVDGRFRPSEAVHLGVAIALRGGGLIAPAIHDAAEKSLEVLMHELSDLIVRTRSGALRGSELADPTLTVTHLGEPGVEEVYGIIHPPQVAIVGIGKVVQTAVAVDGAVTVRPRIAATLSGDHRVTDGHDGGRFLEAVETLLQTPEAL